ncbi:histone deacetylase [Pseudoscourfieldia marina]
MYISLHRYGTAGNYFYPGTGDATEVGAEGAEGRNLCGNGDYLAAFDWVILPIIRELAPQLIIVAAGFDAAQGDPLGGCRVTPTGYA